MKKFFATVFACLLLVTSSAYAEIFKDAEGFSYINNYNYLVFSSGNKSCNAYDISSIHILANDDSRFEFNVIVVHCSNGNGIISTTNVANIREDYATGNIFMDGDPLGDYRQWGKTQREIYYKMKSAALSR